MKFPACGLIVLITFLLHDVHCEKRLVRKRRNIVVDTYSNFGCKADLEEYEKFKKVNMVNKTEINFILKTYDKIHNKVVDSFILISDPEALWNHANYKKDRPLVIFISGYFTNLDKRRSKSHDALTSAFVKFRPDINFVTIDTARYLAHWIGSYHKSAICTLQLADHLTEALKKFLKNHARIVDRMQLIGHSLGAQICGKIGRDLKSTGIEIPRITGLDPAGPCFYEEGLLTGLSRGDAKFVDVIHTNPKTFGKKERIGDIDFYPNGNEDNDNAPGCNSMNKLCSHARSWKYFAETVVVGNENNFLPTSCVLDDNSKCDTQMYPMGFAANATYPKGKYFLTTNAECPFGPNNQDQKMTEVCDVFIRNPNNPLDSTTDFEDPFNPYSSLWLW